MTEADERVAVTPGRARPVVLILGGGFGGLGAARSLKRADAEVVLVDAHDYHTFQPMVYQLATDLIEPSEVAHPLRDRRELRAHTPVWGAGLRAHPLAESLGLELELGNRIPVDDDLAIAGHPEACAVGDIAWITDAKTGDVLPQLGSVALQAGEYAGENIAGGSPASRRSRSGTTTRERWQRSGGARP
jgi:NADH dehydrogenase FAD-containing subunit